MIQTLQISYWKACLAFYNENSYYQLEIWVNYFYINIYMRFLQEDEFDYHVGIGTKDFVKVFHDRMFDIKMWIQALKLNCEKRLRYNIVRAVPKPNGLSSMDTQTNPSKLWARCYQCCSSEFFSGRSQEEKKNAVWDHTFMTSTWNGGGRS